MFIKGISGEEGEVIEVRGDTATVKIQANKACEKCHVCKRVSATEMIVEAFATRPVSRGEKVTLHIHPGTIVKSAAILYIFPLFGLIIGYYCGKFLLSLLNIGIKGELIPAVFSLVFLFLSFVPIRMYDRSRQKDSRFRVFISN
jgi:sigma-E factor negative regulatory protein RseC